MDRNCEASTYTIYHQDQSFLFSALMHFSRRHALLLSSFNVMKFSLSCSSSELVERARFF